MADTQVDTSDRRNPNIFQFDTVHTGADHPECEPDEIFLSYGNTWTRDQGYPRYETLRCGTTVIDDFGRDRTEDAKGGLFPIFAKREEHDRIQKELRGH